MAALMQIFQNILNGMLSTFDGGRPANQKILAPDRWQYVTQDV
jgi:hypothetical protein